MGRIARVRSGLADRLTRARARSSIIDGLAQTWEHDSEVGGGVMSGALAFRMFLFLMPFVLFMFTLFGSAATVANRTSEDLAASVGISGLLAKGMVNAESLGNAQKWLILAVSGYAMVVASRSLVKTLVTAVCLAWRIPRVRMKMTKPALLFIVYFTVTSLLTSGLGRLREAAPTPGVALTAAWLAVPLISIWWLMAKLPRRETPTWALLPGAVVAAVGFQAMHVLTVVLIVPSAESKSET